MNNDSIIPFFHGVFPYPQRAWRYDSGMSQAPHTAEPLIDGHCHLDDPRFDDDREAVVHRAHDARVTQILIPSVAQRYWQRTEAVGQRYNCPIAFGLHPYWLTEHQPRHLDDLSDWVDKHPCIAIGECGLDYRPKLAADQHQKDHQLSYFTTQLDIAQAAHKPVIVHATQAVDAVTQQLRKRPGLRAQIHSYSGSLQQAHKLLDLGALLSFSANITHPRAQRQHRLIRELPLNAIAFETDAPNQPGHHHKGQRNEPAWLIDTVQTAAHLRQISLATMIQHSNQNLRELFALETSHV